MRSKFLRQSFESRSDLLSPVRRYHVLFTLVGATFFLLGSMYTYMGEYFESTLGIPPAVMIQIHPISDLDRSDEVSYLWSYVTAIDTPGRRQTWDWVASQRREGYRRPSWGALREQGAKAHIRENLYPDRKYLNSYPVAGWNNQVIDVINIIAVALRTNHIPIVGLFAADTNHLHHEAVFLSASEVFDFSDLVAHYGVPVVDVFELKVGAQVDERHKSVVYDGEHPRHDVQVGQKIHAEEPSLDTLKCWDAYATVREPGGYPTPIQPSQVEITPLPLYVYANISEPSIGRLSLPLTAQAIAAYSSPSATLPADSVARLAELGLPPSTMSPDDPFTCVNQVFFACLDPHTGDMGSDYKQGIGAWEEVGRYLKFQPGLEMIANDLLRALMGIPQGQNVPPYMAVHIRRTDFGYPYNTLDQADYAHQAWLLLQKVRSEQGLTVKHIVFTTDELDEDWLNVLRALGWIHIDHNKIKTGERLGWWYPTLLDSVILSSAKIFLGNPSSTMSMLPYRRVLDSGGMAGFIQPSAVHTPPPGWEWSIDW